MTDETREQIRIDAKNYELSVGNTSSRYTDADFRAGATHQHPISFEQGRKEGIKDAIASVKKYDAYSVHVDSMKEDILKQLESLRNDNDLKL